MIESDQGLYAILETCFNHIVVMSQGKFINLTSAKWEDPGPRDRERVRLHTESGNASNVYVLISH